MPIPLSNNLKTWEKTMLFSVYNVKLTNMVFQIIFQQNSRCTSLKLNTDNKKFLEQ